MPPKDPYGPDNTGPDGDYIVGKGRPPHSGKFRKGDGRRRGRRPKGTRNLATDLREELEGMVPVTVGGVTKKVTRQRAVVMRLADQAMKGQNTAIATVLDLEQRLVAPVRRREEERKQAERKRDYSCLSIQELQILESIMSKVDGKNTGASPLPVAIPTCDEVAPPCSDTHDASEGAERASGEGPRIHSGPPEGCPDET